MNVIAFYLMGGSGGTNQKMLIKALIDLAAQPHTQVLITTHSSQVVKALGFDTNYDEYFEKFFVPTDLSKAPEIFGKNGLKSYSFEKAQFVSTYIEATDTKLLCDYRQFVTDYDGDFLGIWIDYTQPKTFVYFKHNGTVHHLTYDCIASRAATIMPQIVKLF